MKTIKAIPFLLILILCALSGVPRATAQNLYVGSNSSSQTTNFTSGTNSYTSIYIGLNNGDTNNLLAIVNSGTLLANSQNLFVGFSGSGNSLTISNAGSVNNGIGYIGFISSNNTVLVTGTNSLWSNSSDLYVGYEGAGNSLTISQAGSVNNRTGYIGLDFNNNTVLVTGTNSLWSNSSDLYVGVNGAGNSLTISNAGTVKNRTGYVGYNATSSNNTVLVTGTNSLWSNSSTLNVGKGGSGTLTLAQGGTASASSVTIASQSRSIGTINIGSFGGSDTAGTSPLITPSITFGSGTGTINFNQSDSTTLTSSISGHGSLNQLGSGTTILSRSNSITGTTAISAGTLLVNSNLGSGTVTVNSGGTLAGTGTLGGPVSVSGNLGGNGLTNTLSFTNTLTLNPGSTTTFNIAATNSFDSLKVGGVITYGGGLIFNIGMNSTFASGSSFGIFTDLSGGTNISIVNEWSSVTLTNGSQSWNFTPDGNGNWYSTNNGSQWQFSDANGVLSVWAVPEPSTYELFGIGALVLIVVYRRNIA